MAQDKEYEKEYGEDQKTAVSFIDKMKDNGLTYYRAKRILEMAKCELDMRESETKIIGRTKESGAPIP